MNPTEQDVILRKLLLDALASEWKDTLDAAPESSPSSRQAKRMHSMLRNPKGYAKRFLRPAWKRICEKAAIIILTFLLSFGALYASSATVRAAVSRWLAELRKIDIVYYFFGERTDEGLPYYEITELPEGYTLSGEAVEITSYRKIVYENDSGDYIRLEYSFMDKGHAFFVSTENMNAYDVIVNTSPGQAFLSNDPTQGSVILWSDESAGIQFYIDAPVDQNTLLTLANSVLVRPD